VRQAEAQIAEGQAEAQHEKQAEDKPQPFGDIGQILGGDAPVPVHDRIAVQEDVDAQHDDHAGKKRQGFGFLAGKMLFIVCHTAVECPLAVSGSILKQSQFRYVQFW